MAYVYTYKRYNTTADNSITFSLPVAAAANDFITVTVAIRRSGATPAITGYSNVHTKISSTWEILTLGKIATGGEQSITVTNSGTSASGVGWIAMAYVWRQADVSGGTVASVVDGTPASVSSTAQTISSPTYSTGVADSALLHAIIWDINTPSVNPADLNVYMHGGVQGSHASGVTVKGASGAIPTFTWYGESSRAGVSLVIGIKNATSGTKQPYLADGRTIAKRFGNYDTQTLSAPDQGGTLVSINSINMSSTTATQTNGSGPTSSDWVEYVSLISSAESTGLPCWSGAFFADTTDVAGKNISIQFGMGAQITRVASEGVIFVFLKDSSNWVAYQLRDTVNMSVNQGYTAFITPGVTTAYASAGTVTFSDITKVGIFYHRASFASTTSVPIYIGRYVVSSSAGVFYGGSSSWPVTVGKESIPLLGANTSSKGASYQGFGQLIDKFSVQYGDGTNPVYVKHGGQSVETPASTDIDWRIGTEKVSVTLYGSSTCTFDFSASLLVTSSKQTFTIHASSSTSATYNFVGCSFIGWVPTWKTGIECNGAIFDACYPVNFKGANVTNVTVKNTLAVAGEAAVVFDTSGATVTSTTIDVTGTSAGYHLELGTAVTAITLTDVTFTGTPGTDKVHVLKTTGTVTININGSTSLAAGDVTSAGATVSIVSSPVNQSVTVSGFTAGSRIQIYDTTSSTELFNGTASAGNTVVSGTTATWTDPATASASRAIRIRVSYVSGATAKEFIEANIGTCGILEGSEAVSYLANQVNDSVYNTNAVNGSAVTGITFTDAATDVININLTAPVDIPDIYAAWVYYAFTATGIATDIDYINAIDPANYEFSNLIIKNTTSPTQAMKLQGGYFWDAVTLDPMDCIDTTGGTLFLAPPHVVPKIISTSDAVISGTAAEIIAAIPTASENATAVWSKTLPL